AARFWNWIRVHDLKPLNGKPWNFISQTQFGIGIGPRWSPIPHTQLPNFVEYRASLQKLTYSDNGADTHSLHMVNDIGPKLGARIARLLPWLLRRDPNTEWSPIWRGAMAERQAAYHDKLRRRGLLQLDTTITAQRTQLAEVRVKIARTEDRIRALNAAIASAGLDPLGTRHVRSSVAPTLFGLRLRLAHQRRLGNRLIAAINTNQSRRAEIEEGPGSALPAIAPGPVRLTLVPARPGPGGTVASGTQPADQLSAPGAGRVGFELPGVAGRSDPGHPENRNFDAMAVIRGPNGRVVAAVADQQGYAEAPAPSSRVAVEAAMASVADALAADPDTPGRRLARLAFAAAAAATAPGATTSTFLLVIVTPTGPDSSEASFIWVGDSRAYAVDATGTEQVTDDHTWSAATTAEATPANEPVQYVTRWIGRDAAFAPGTDTRQITGPARIVLTTDELHDFYPDEAGLGAVVTAASDPAAAADGLIDQVRARGSGNKTAIVIEVNTGATTTGHSGAVVRRPGYHLTQRERLRLPKVLAELIDYHGATWHRYRGEQWIVSLPLDERVLGAFRDAEIGELVGLLVAYYWAERDVVVVIEPMLDILIETGLLEDVMDHEDVFHRKNETTRSGRGHRVDAKMIDKKLAERGYPAPRPAAPRPTDRPSRLRVLGVLAERGGASAATLAEALGVPESEAAAMLELLVAERLADDADGADDADDAHRPGELGRVLLPLLDTGRTLHDLALVELLTQARAVLARPAAAELTTEDMFILRRAARRAGFVEEREREREAADQAKRSRPAPRPLPELEEVLDKIRRDPRTRDLADELAAMLGRAPTLGAVLASIGRAEGGVGLDELDREFRGAREDLSARLHALVGLGVLVPAEDGRYRLDPRAAARLAELHQHPARDWFVLFLNGWPTPHVLRVYDVVLRDAFGLPEPGRASDGIDAIVVPTGRSASWLHNVFQLGAATGTLVVTLSSGDSSSRDIAAVAAQYDNLAWIGIDVPNDYRHELLEFETSRHPAASFARTTDVSRKRNIGLLLAKMLDWKKIVFLDDDIVVHPDQLDALGAALDRESVAGLSVTYSRDYSVSGRILRRYEVRSDLEFFNFSGGAMGVAVDADHGFFAEVGGEDILFALDAYHRHSLTFAGTALQYSFGDGDPARAAAEEFGDVLADEAFRSSRGYRDGSSSFWADGAMADVLGHSSYWAGVIAHRLADLRAAAAMNHGEPRSTAMLRAAMDRYEPGRPDSITAESFAEFVRAYLADYRRWRSAWNSLPAMPGMDDALRHLRLHSHSGPVIKGHWPGWLRAWWERVLPWLARGVQARYDPARPRGPPILEIPLSWPVRALLLVTGLWRMPSRLAGYYWADRDAVVIFTPTLTRLRRSGLLGRLLDHEDFFHRQGNEHARNRRGLTHDEDAHQIIDALDGATPSMTVDVLGVSGSAPVFRDGALVGTSSYLVRTPGGMVLLDAGVGAAQGLAGLGLGSPDAVFITHLHDDHFAELVELARAGQISGGRLRVYGPAALRDELARRLGNEASPALAVTVLGAGRVSTRDRAGALYSANGSHVLVGAGPQADAWLGGLGLRDGLAAVVVPSLRDEDIAGLLFLGQNRLYPKDRTGAAAPVAANRIPVYGPAGLAGEVRARSRDRGYPVGIDQAFEFHTIGEGTRVDIAGMAVTTGPHPDRNRPAETAETVDDLFDLVELGHGRTVRVADLAVTPFAVDHLGMDAYALRVAGPPGAGTLAYSGDTGHTGALVEAAQDADLALFNSFSLASAELGGLHLSGRTAAATARAAGVRRLALVHHHWNADAAAILAEARRHFRGPLWSARVGDHYRVRHGGHVPAGHLAALDDRGEFVDPHAPEMAGVLAAVHDAARAVEAGGGLRRARRGAVMDASPRGRWAAEGLGFALGTRFNEVLAGLLAERGLLAVRVVYFLDRERAWVVADQELFSQLRRLPPQVRQALEDHELIHWRHPDWDERAVWRHAGDEAHEADEAPTPAGLPAHPLRGVRFVRSLGGPAKTVRGGRPKVMELSQGGTRLVAKQWDHDPGTVVRAALAATIYRLVGVPASTVRFAVAVEDVYDRDPSDPDAKIVIDAGDVLELAEYIPGETPGLDSEEHRAALAAEFVITALLRDWDGLRAKRDNLKLRDGLLYRVDFDTALPNGPGLPEDGFRIPDSAGEMEQLARAVYGRLTEADLLAQFDHVHRLRDQILALVPAGDLHRMMTARLDWIARVVTTRQLPTALLTDLDSARRAWSERFPQDRPNTPPPHAGPTTGHTPTVPTRLRLATPTVLHALVEAGIPVWVHGWRPGLWGEGRWEISLPTADVAAGRTHPWEPNVHPTDPERLRAALLELPGLRPPPGAATRPATTSADPLAHLAELLAGAGIEVTVVQPEMVMADGFPTLLGALEGRPAENLADRATWLAGELSTLGRLALWIRSDDLTHTDLDALAAHLGAAHPELNWIYLATDHHTTVWRRTEPSARAGGWLTKAVRFVARAWGNRGPPVTHGAVVLVDYGTTTARQRRVIASVAERAMPAGAAEFLPPGRLVGFGGLLREHVDLARNQGLVAVDDFNRDIVRGGGPAGVVFYVHDDGTAYTDTRTLAALRAGVLAPGDLTDLLLTTLATQQGIATPSAGRWSRELDRPDLSPLRPVVEAPAPGWAGRLSGWLDRAFGHDLRSVAHGIGAVAAFVGVTTAVGTLVATAVLAPVLQELMTPVLPDLAIGVASAVALWVTGRVGMHLSSSAAAPSVRTALHAAMGASTDHADTGVALRKAEKRLARLRQERFGATDPRGLEQRINALEAEVARLETRLRRMELTGDPRIPFRIEAWDGLDERVRAGLTEAYGLLVRTGVAGTLHAGKAEVEVRILPDRAFHQAWRTSHKKRRKGPPQAFVHRRVMYLRESTFRFPSRQNVRRNERVIAAARVLVHEWVHVVDLTASHRQMERNAFLADGHLGRALHLAVRLAQAPPGERERLQRLFDAWRELLEQWRPTRQAPMSYRLSPYYDDVPEGTNARWGGNGVNGMNGIAARIAEFAFRRLHGGTGERGRKGTGDGGGAVAATRAELDRHVAAGRLASDIWELLDQAGSPEAARRLAQRVEFARAFGIDPASGSDRFGFVPDRDADGRPVWRLPTSFGEVVLTGEQLSLDGRDPLSPAANAVSSLVASAFSWLPPRLDESERPARLLELVAAAARLTPTALGEAGGVRAARVRFDRPVATLTWQGGAWTRDMELVTWEIEPGRHLLVGFHPVAEDAPTGLAHSDALAEARRGVVAIRDPLGQVIGTGWVVEAATDSRPARVRTAYHVAELFTAGHTVDGLTITDVRALPLAGYGDLSERAADAQNSLERDPKGDRLPTLDLAEFSVWGLERPAVPTRTEPVEPGEPITVIGYPEGIGLITQAPALAERRGLVESLVALGGGVSGAPGFDAHGRVVVTVVGGRAGRLYGIAPDLSTGFGDRVTGEAGRPVPPLPKRNRFGTPGPSPAGLARALDGSLTSVERLIDELAAGLDANSRAALDVLAARPTQFLDHVGELLLTAPGTEPFRVFTERADAARAALEGLHAAATARRATDTGGPAGGAVAVARDTGAGTRLGRLQNRRVRAALARLRAHTREVPPGHPAHRLVDPRRVWAGHDYRPRLYAVTGLNRELGDQPFAVVLFVAPDPNARGRLAVFVDAGVLANMPLLGEAERALLADRELARLRGLAEHEVQRMPLPPPAALLTLLRPEPAPDTAAARATLQARAVLGELSLLLAELERLELAGPGIAATRGYLAARADRVALLARAGFLDEALREYREIAWVLGAGRGERIEVFRALLRAAETLVPAWVDAGRDVAALLDTAPTPEHWGAVAAGWARWLGANDRTAQAGELLERTNRFTREFNEQLPPPDLRTVAGLGIPANVALGLLRGRIAAGLDDPDYPLPGLDPDAVATLMPTLRALALAAEGGIEQAGRDVELIDGPAYRVALGLLDDVVAERNARDLDLPADTTDRAEDRAEDRADRFDALTAEARDLIARANGLLTELAATGHDLTGQTLADALRLAASGERQEERSRLLAWAVIGHAPTEGPVDPAYRSAALIALGELADAPLDARNPWRDALTRTVVEVLDLPLAERGADRDELTGRVEWLAGADPRARLAYAVVLAATQGSWPLDELTRARLAAPGLVTPHLVGLARLVTDPTLAPARDALTDLLVLALPESADHRDLEPLLSAWVELADTVASLAPALSREDLLDEVVALLPTWFALRGDEHRELDSVPGALDELRLGVTTILADRLGVVADSDLWELFTTRAHRLPADVARALRSFDQHLRDGHRRAAANALARNAWNGELRAIHGPAAFAEHRRFAATDEHARIGDRDVVIGEVTDLALLDELAGRTGDYLHPRQLVLGVWAAGHGERGQRQRGRLLGHAVLFLSPDGILPLGPVHGPSNLDLGPTLRDYIWSRATRERMPVLAPRGWDLDWLTPRRRARASGSARLPADGRRSLPTPAGELALPATLDHVRVHQPRSQRSGRGSWWRWGGTLVALAGGFLAAGMTGSGHYADAAAFLPILLGMPSSGPRGPPPAEDDSFAGLPLELLDVAAIEGIEGRVWVDGKPKVLRARDGSGRALFLKHAHPSEHHALVTWVAVSWILRVFGIPVPRTWLAIADRDIEHQVPGLSKPVTVVRAGDVVVAQEKLPGREPGLHELGPWRRHLAGRLAATLLARDADGIRPHNLLLDRSDPPTPPAQFDFDKAMLDTPWSRSDDAGLLISGNFPVFGLLTAEDMLALLSQALALRGPLLAAMPNERLRAEVAAGLDWMAEAVADGLPRVVLNQLQTAAQRAAQDSFRNGYQPDSGYQRLAPPADPGLPPPLRDGQRRLAHPAELLELRLHGHQIRVHEHRPDGRWDVTVAGGSGGLAEDGMSRTDAAAFASVLPSLEEHAAVDGDLPLPYLDDDLPVLLLDPERARPWLARVGLEDLPERLVAFAWLRPGRGNLLVMFSNGAGELAELDALGMPVRAWWQRVVGHERGHLNGRWDTTSDSAHNSDTADLLSELWDMRAWARLGPAGRELLDALRGEGVQQQLMPRRAIGNNPYLLVDAHGREIAIHKLATSILGNEAAREIAGYIVDDELGAGLVPLTIRWDGGSAQRWIHGSSAHVPASSFSTFEQQLAAVVDYIIGATDRHGPGYNNFRGEQRADGTWRLWLIDNGDAFPSRNRLARETTVEINSPFVRAQQGAKLDTAVLDLVDAVDQRRLARRLSEVRGLGDYEIDAVLARLREIQQRRAITGEVWRAQKREARQKRDVRKRGSHNGPVALWPLDGIEEDALTAVLPELTPELRQELEQWGWSARGPPELAIVPADRLAERLTGYYREHGHPDRDGRDTVAKLGAYTVDRTIYLTGERAAQLDDELLGDVLAHEFEEHIEGRALLGGHDERAEPLAARLRHADEVWRRRPALDAADREVDLAERWVAEGRPDLARTALRRATDRLDELDDWLWADPVRAMRFVVATDGQLAIVRGRADSLSIPNTDTDTGAGTSTGIDTRETPAGAPADPLRTGAVLPIWSDGTQRGVAWAIGPDLWVGSVGGFGPSGDVGTVRIGSEPAGTVLRTEPSDHGEHALLAEHADLLFGWLRGHPGAGLVLFRGPAAGAATVRLSDRPARRGDLVTIVGHDGGAVRLNGGLAVLAAGEATLTVRAELNYPSVGAPVLGADGRVVGMVEHVDPDTGLVTASTSAPLRLADSARRARGLHPPATLLGWVDELFELVDAALAAGNPERAGELLDEVAIGLDTAARELGARRDTRLEPEDYDDGVARLIESGHRWHARSPRLGQDTENDLAVGRLLSAAVRAAERGDRVPPEVFDAVLDAALLVGDPRAWRAHLTFDHDPQRLAAAIQKLARRQPAVTQADLVTAPARTAAVLRVLIDQLPPAQARPLAAALDAWERAGELIDDLPALRNLLPTARTTPDQARAGVAVARIWLGRLRAMVDKYGNQWRPNSPPGGGLTTRRFDLDEHRKVVAGFRPILSRLPDAEHGPGFLLVDWPLVRPLFEREGLPNLGREMIAYTVFDRLGRAWEVRFAHVDEAIRALPADVAAYLDELISKHERGHAVRRDAAHPEDGWAGHEQERQRIVGLVLAALAGRAIPLPESYTADRATHAGHTLSALLTAIGTASADPARSGVTPAELARRTELAETTVLVRLATLVGWGLVEREPITDEDVEAGEYAHGYRYRLAAHTVRLLADVANPPGPRTSRYRRALRALAYWLDKAAGLEPDVPTTDAIASALDRVREIRGSPLHGATARASSNSLRGILDVLAALPEGATTAELLDRTPRASLTNLRQRLAGLVALRLVDQVSDTRPGGNPRESLYRLSGPAARFLPMLDGLPYRSRDPRDRVLRTVTGLLNKPALLDPGSQARRQLEDALDLAALLIPDNPLAEPFTSAPPDSWQGTLEAVASAPEGMSTEELAALPPGIGVRPMRIRVRTLTKDMGLLRRDRDSRPGANANAKVYFLSEDGQRLLLALHHPARHAKDIAELRALRTLAVLLRTPTNKLGPGSKDKIAKALAKARKVRTVRAGPRGGKPRAGTSDDGGAVVLGKPLRRWQRRWVANRLRAQANRLTPLEELPHRMPRGPPGVRVLIAGDDVAVPFAGRLVAFGWAERGVVVITRAMLDEIAAHLAAGRLPAGWWYRLLAHERDFHLDGHEHDGARHDGHAAAIADEFLLARARALSVKEVLAVVREHPGINNRTLAALLGLSTAKTNKKMTALTMLGLIRSERAGKPLQHRYFRTDKPERSLPAELLAAPLAETDHRALLRRDEPTGPREPKPAGAGRPQQPK
ncbi:MBL fold metallo-hydrolase, partial [Pseudonocardia acaciae]|uniref:MBL fold metallo-hydrolase n=1 Tax=Pseudonocardia acaciae TaxID=551276 RepID=UPI00055E066C